MPSLRRCPLEDWPTLRSPFDPAKPVASVHFAFPDIMGMWFNLVQCPVHAAWLPVVQRGWRSASARWRSASARWRSASAWSINS